jgi:thioredoxin reductase (NADPH)
LIYRKEKIRAEPILVERIDKDPKIKIINNTNVIETFGEKFLEGVVFDNEYDGNTKFGLNGLFVEIGYEPQTSLPKSLGVELKDGIIKVNEKQETNIEGVYAAGDCTTSSNGFHQVVTAASEGTIASEVIYNFLKNKK